MGIEYNRSVKGGRLLGTITARKERISMALSIIEANPNGVDLPRLYSLIEYNTGVRRVIAEEYVHVLIDLGLCESRPEGVFPMKSPVLKSKKEVREKK